MVDMWYRRARAEKAVSSLVKNGFEAVYVTGCDLALEEVLKKVPAGSDVGAGGSVTIRRMGIIEALRSRGHTVYDHWEAGLSGKELLVVRKAQLNAGVFITSSNAVTLDGKLVNTDASGNRVAAMSFGPGRVIVVAGANKIVKDVGEAMERIKFIAAPKNCHRRNDPTPCAKSSLCSDCGPSTRLCRVTSIIEAKPWAIKDYTVIIVGEDLGY